MRIGVAGLGAMGSAIAARLMEVGHQVTVWNRTAAKTAPLAAAGARVVDSPAAVAAASEAIITILTDGAAPLRRNVEADHAPAGGHEILREGAAHDAEADDTDGTFLSRSHSIPHSLARRGDMASALPAQAAFSRSSFRGARKRGPGIHKHRPCRILAGVMVSRTGSMDSGFAGFARAPE